MTDMIVRIVRMPELGETLEGTSFKIGNGGKGANQAVMAASLGAEVEMVACVGSDPFGNTAIENFESWGIGTSAVRRVAEASTGVAPIFVDPDGANRVLIVPGANALMQTSEVHQLFGEMESPDVVLCQLEIPLDCVVSALQEGRKAGATTILNPAPFQAFDASVLDLVDWLVPNEVEFEALRSSLMAGAAGELAEDVVELGALLGVALAVTCGEHGVLVYQPGIDDQAVHVSAPAVKVVDTTGAGDAFAGAFSYALGSGAAPQVAAQFASSCASASVEHEGTQSSYPTGERLDVLKSMLDAESLEAPS